MCKVCGITLFMRWGDDSRINCWQLRHFSGILLCLITLSTATMLMRGRMRAQLSKTLGQRKWITFTFRAMLLANQ